MLQAGQRWEHNGGKFFAVCCQHMKGDSIADLFLI
jgi:hypothetical protein